MVRNWPKIIQIQFKKLACVHAKCQNWLGEIKVHRLPLPMDWKRFQLLSLHKPSNCADDDGQSKCWCRFAQMLCRTHAARSNRACSTWSHHSLAEYDFYAVSQGFHRVRSIQPMYSIAHRHGRDHVQESVILSPCHAVELATKSINRGPKKFAMLWIVSPVSQIRCSGHFHNPQQTQSMASCHAYKIQMAYLAVFKEIESVQKIESKS